MVVQPLALWAVFAVCVAGAVAAAVSGNWSAALFAVVAASNAVGWILTNRRWQEWRNVALKGMTIIDEIVYGEDGPPSPVGDNPSLD